MTLLRDRIHSIFIYLFIREPCTLPILSYAGTFAVDISDASRSERRGTERRQSRATDRPGARADASTWLPVVTATLSRPSSVSPSWGLCLIIFPARTQESRGRSVRWVSLLREDLPRVLDGPSQFDR